MAKIFPGSVQCGKSRNDILGGRNKFANGCYIIRFFKNNKSLEGNGATAESSRRKTIFIRKGLEIMPKKWKKLFIYSVMDQILTNWMLLTTEQSNEGHVTF